MRKINRFSILLLVGVLFVCFCQPIMAGSGKININVASKDQLVSLKYVGDKTADKIIKYRKAHPFEKASDIMKVKGIGQKVLDANKDLIVVKDE